MGVYLYPSGTETELKNAYIGEYQEGWHPGANTVAYRPLNSTTTVNDQSGNGYNLTQTGGGFTTLDGVDCFYNGGSTTGYFELTSGANIPTGNADRTILLWVRPIEYASSRRCFIDYGGSIAGAAVYIEVVSTSGKPNASIYNTDVTGSNSMSTSSWSLLTFTSTGNTFNLYMNGTSEGTSSSGTINTTAISSTYPLRLMRQNTNTSSSYQVRGYISEVIIENKTRTAQEIAAYYNQTKGNYGIS